MTTGSNHLRASIHAFAPLAAATVLAACNRGGDGADPPVGATIDFSMSVVGSVPAESSGPSEFGSLAQLAAMVVTSNAKNVAADGAGLESLKLYFNDIHICQDVTLNGTMITGMEGCVTVYKAPVEPGDLSNTSDLAASLAAAEATTEGYIDVLDPESRAEIAQQIVLMEEDVGEYNYGVFGWAPPIKVTATLVDPADGTTPVLYTKPGVASACSVNNNAYDCVLTDDPLTGAPAEEAIFVAGGNVVFKFQRALSITAEDVENQTTFALTLAFNPNGLIQGVTSPGATNFPPIADGVVPEGSTPGYNMGNSLSLVGPQVAAVFYQSDSQIIRESYSATLPAGGGNGTFKLRVEFYWLDGDPDRTIYGTTAAIVPTADTRGYLVGFYPFHGITTNTNGSINLLDHMGELAISQFVRSTAEGATSTAGIQCDSQVMGITANCTVGSSLTATFNLDALEPLD